MLVILFLLAIVGGFAFWANRKSKAQLAAKNQAELDDAIADARRWIERLGSQVLSLSGTDAASTQAIADASERYNAASSQISTANTAKQAKLARESALEGLYYINAAREIMGMTPGPELPLLEGQKQAGKVMEQRTIEYEGQQITASPVATAETPRLLGVRCRLAGIRNHGGCRRSPPACGLLGQRCCFRHCFMAWPAWARV